MARDISEPLPSRCISWTDANQCVDGRAVAGRLHLGRHLQLHGLPPPRGQLIQLRTGVCDTPVQAPVKPLGHQAVQGLLKTRNLGISTGMAFRLRVGKVSALRAQKRRRHAPFALDFMHQFADRGGQLGQLAQVAHVRGNALLAHQYPQNKEQKPCDRQGQRQCHALAYRDILQSDLHHGLVRMVGGGRFATAAISMCWPLCGLGPCTAAPEHQKASTHTPMGSNMAVFATVRTCPFGFTLHWAS